MRHKPFLSVSGTLFSAAFITTIPVLLGYTAIGIAFGLLLVHAGYPLFLAPIMSLLIYAGAAQYIAVGLFTAGAGLFEIAAVTLLVNSRHMVYGLSLIDRFSAAGRYKPYLIFALTDETYALLTSVETPSGADTGRFAFLVSLFDQSYWIIGSTLGAVIGSVLPFRTDGLEFALIALFVVLFIEQFKTCRWKLPFVIAGFTGILVIIFAGTENMLIISLILSVAVLLSVRKAAPEVKTC